MTDSYHELNVLFNIIIDDYGGRHSKIEIGNDGMLFVIWESDTKGAIGIAHCIDIYCKNMTKSYLDNPDTTPYIGYSFANQAYMRISPYTGYPQILYSLTNSSSGTIYYLRFATCRNYNCSKYHIINVLDHTKTPALINNGNNFYVYFVYNTLQSNNDIKIFISYNQDPYGLYLIECMNIECDDNNNIKTNNGPLPIVTSWNSTGWYNSMYLLQESIILFMYYNNDTFTLDYTFYNYTEQVLLKSGTFVENVHGAWLSTTNITDVEEPDLSMPFQVVLVYVDIVSGDYNYGWCNISNDIDGCQITVIDTNISDATNDYDLWVYPDIEIIKKFNDYPITTYFDINSLKIAQCGNDACNDNIYIQKLSQGSFGYGRDSSIEWYDKYDILYISFLDYNGNGNDKKARLLICDSSTF